MSKYNEKRKNKAANEQEKLNKSVLSNTDNQNLNENHNVKKEALGPNTNR